MSKSNKLFAVYLLVLCMFLSGCFRDVKPYNFRQGVNQIESIEIRRKMYDSSSLSVPTILLKTMEMSEHRALIDSVKSLSGNYLYTNPTTGIGLYQIWIYYKDGEIEKIGAYNNCYVLPNGDWQLDCYMFEVSQFYEMLSSFLGEIVTDMLPQQGSTGDGSVC